MEWGRILNLLIDVGYKEDITFHFNEVIDDVSISKYGALSIYGLVTVLEDDNLVHICHRYIG